MDDDFANLPPDIVAKLMALVREVDGEVEVINDRRFLDFIDEYGRQYPALRRLVELNEDAVREHFERTGDVPSGIKLIRTTTREGDNVTKLEIFWGPNTRKPEK